ncbi:uncharacterized protein LOC135809695 [Sycon ciliatum]|uniref:uncharacterized protein LOC135809695 n=1 Tax=Sycon ciliatum TaxID=27933 RepID=UPI0031F6664B
MGLERLLLSLTVLTTLWLTREVASQTINLCPLGLYNATSMALPEGECLPCPINCEDARGVNGTCRVLDDGSFRCSARAGVIKEVNEIDFPMGVSQGAPIRGQGVTAEDADVDEAPTLDSLRISFADEGFMEALDEVTFDSGANTISNIMGIQSENGRTVELVPNPPTATPTVQSFVDALVFVTIFDNRDEPRFERCFEVTLNDGVNVSPPSELCVGTIYVNDKRPQIACTTNARVIDVEAPQTAFVEAVNCTVTDADVQVGQQATQVSLSGGPDVVYQTGTLPMPLTSGGTGNMVSITGTAHVAVYEAALSLLMVAVLLPNNEFNGLGGLTRALTIQVQDGSLPSGPPCTSGPQLTLVPIPERTPAITVPSTPTLFTENGGPAITLAALTNVLTTETFYTLSSVRYTLAQTVPSDPENFTIGSPIADYSLDGSIATLSTMTPTEFQINYNPPLSIPLNAVAPPGPAFPALSRTVYLNTADELGCGRSRQLNVVTVPFNALLGGPDPDVGVVGSALAEQFLQLNGDNDNAPVLTLAPSMQTVAEDSSITVFNTVAITDNDDVVPCDRQCFNELRFTVANPPVLAANALVIDPVGASGKVLNASFQLMGTDIGQINFGTEPLNIIEAQDAIGRLTFQALGDNPSESLFLNDFQLVEAESCEMNAASDFSNVQSGDDSGASGSGVFDTEIAIIPVNDGPSVTRLDTPGPCQATFFENPGNSVRVVRTTGFWEPNSEPVMVNDPEGDDVSVLKAKITANLDVGDRLNLTVDFIDGDPTVTYNKQTGELIVNFTTPVSADIISAQFGLFFSNNNPGLVIDPREITIKAYDTFGAAGAALVLTLCICPFNNPPKLQAEPGSDTATRPYTSGKFVAEPPLAIGNNTVVKDPDDINLVGVTCTLSDAIFLEGNMELLLFNTTRTSVTVTPYVNISTFTAVYRLENGASVAEYQRVVRSMSYENLRMEVPGQLDRSVRCVGSDGTSESSFTITIPIVIIPAAHLQMATPGLRRVTLRDVCVSALGDNYTVKAGETDFVRSFNITVFERNSREPCATACNPLNNIRLVLPGMFENVEIEGNGTSSISFSIPEGTFFTRLVVPEVAEIMRQVKLYSDFVATEMLSVRSTLFDWPVNRMSAVVMTAIDAAVVNRRPVLGDGSMCFNQNVSAPYLPTDDDSPEPVEVDDIISALEITDLDVDSEEGATIVGVSFEPATVAAILQYRRGAMSAWRNVPSTLNGIVEPGVGVPILAGFQLRVLPLPSVGKVSGCVRYAIAAYDNTTRNTSGLFPEEFPYSEDNITCQICFEYENLRPVRESETFTLPIVFEDSNNPASSGVQVESGSGSGDITLYNFAQDGSLVPAMPTAISMILMNISSDQDDVNLAIALRNAVTNGVGTFQYSNPPGTVINNIPNDLSPMEYVVLRPPLLILFDPELHANGIATIEARAYDNSAIPAGNTGRVTVTDFGPSSPLSAEITIITQIVEPVNDRPVVDLNGPLLLGLDQTVEFVEESAQAIYLTPDAQIFDVEFNTLANLTVVFDSVYPGEDVINFVAPNSLTVATDDVSTGGMRVMRTITAQPASGPNAPKADYSEFLRSFTYINTNDEFTGSRRTASATAHDGKSPSRPSALTINLISTNDAPEFEPPAPRSINATEQASPDTIRIPNIFQSIVTDDDSASVSEVTVRLDGIRNDGERLAIAEGSTLGSSFTLSGDSNMTSRVYNLAIGGASFMDTSNAIQLIEYVNIADEPLNGERTISVVVRDSMAGPITPLNPFGGTSAPLETFLSTIPVNDNAPVFTQMQYDTCAPEGARGFTVTSSISATDADSINQVQDLRFFFICPNMSLNLGLSVDGMLTELEGTAAPGSGGSGGESGSGSGMDTQMTVCDVFGIDNTTGIVTSCDGELCAVPRRLLHPSITIPMRVTDGEFNGTATLNITIVEANNNAPRFTDNAGVSVDESFLGVSVTTVMAVDDDVFPPNNVIEYSLVDTFDGLFSINMTSGEISTTTGLDYESVCEYNLTVVATDGVGANPDCFFGGRLTATRQLIVTVNDVNEFAPTVPNAATESFAEDTPIGTTILALTVDDGDTGCPTIDNDGDELTYSLQQDSPPLFDIDNEGVITLVASLDFETATMHTVTVVVTDTGTPPRSSPFPLTVNVFNVNDNAPVFGPDSYTATVNEATVLADVLVFTATDADGTLNDLIFSLQGEPTSVSVDPVTGALSIIDTNLDFETDPVITFTAFVNDSMFTDTASVTLNLLDLNDNVPMLRNIMNNTYTIKDRPIDLQPNAIVVDNDEIHPIDRLTIELPGTSAVAQRLASPLPCDCTASPLGTCPNVTALNLLTLMTGPVPVDNGIATFNGLANTVSMAEVQASLVEGFVLSTCIRINTTEFGYLLTILDGSGNVAFAVEPRPTGAIAVSYRVDGARQTFEVAHPSADLFDGLWHNFALELRFPQLRLHVDNVPQTPFVLLPSQRPDGLPDDHSELIIGCHNAQCFRGQVRALVFRVGISNLLHFAATPGAFDGTSFSFGGMAGNERRVAEVHRPGIRTNTDSFEVHVEFELGFAMGATGTGGALVSSGSAGTWEYGVTVGAAAVGQAGSRARFETYHRTCAGSSNGRVRSGGEAFDFESMGGNIQTGRHEVLAQFRPGSVTVTLDGTLTRTLSLSAAEAPCFANPIPSDIDSLLLGAHMRLDSTGTDNRFTGEIFKALVRAGTTTAAEKACLQEGCGECRCGGRCDNLPVCVAGDPTLGCRFDISKYGKCGIDATDLLLLAGSTCTDGEQILQTTETGPNTSLDAGNTDLPSDFSEFSVAAYFEMDPSRDGGVIVVVPGVVAVSINNSYVVVFICVPNEGNIIYVPLEFVLTSTVNNNILHHIAVSGDANNIVVFVDGASLGTQARPANSGTSITRRIYFAFWPMTTHPRFVGTLRAVTLSNKPLSQFDVLCVESCGSFITVADPASVSPNITKIGNGNGMFNTAIDLVGREFEDRYGSVLRTLRYYNLFSEPQKTLPFDQSLRIAVFDNGVSSAAETSISTITVQSAGTPVIRAGDGEIDNVVIVEGGAPAQLVSPQVVILLPVVPGLQAIVIINSIEGGCPLGESLSLDSSISSTCANLTIVNSTQAILLSVDPLNTLSNAVRALRYTCTVPNMVTFSTIFTLTVDISVPGAALVGGTTSDPATVNITSVNNGICVQLQPCLNGATCMEPTPDTFVCNCVEGFTGPNCTTNIDDCMDMPCNNDGVCIDGLNEFQCNCIAGFTGDICQTDIDECSPMPCQNDATCLNLLNRFVCECPTGFTGVTCQTNIDDCDPDPCQNGATCVDGVADFTCNCVTGFTGENCETNIDDCADGPCENGATCTDLVAGFNCTCAPDFTGMNCETQIDDCEPEPCENSGTCIDGINAFTCNCDAAFTGDRCQTEVNECDSMPCQNGATCVEGIGSFECLCPGGFTGVTCESDLNFCTPTICQNGGTCLEGDGVAITCDCAAGFTGQFCMTDIDDCLDNNQCGEGSTCVDLVDGFSCTCASGLTGPLCQTEINECDSNPCENGECVDQLNGFMCNCNDGFTGTLCETDINDCMSEPCMNNGTCQDQIASFVCLCAAGFTGDRCQNISTGMPCDGSDIGTQAGIDALSICTSISGRLTLECESPDESCTINNINALNRVTSIGNLIIRSTRIVNFNGLQALTALTSLVVENNPLLEDISQIFNPAVEACSITISTVTLVDNPALASLAGLNNLGTVTNTLTLQNTGITDMTGLACLATADGISVSSNPSVLSFSGLDRIATIGAFIVSGNPALDSLDGLLSLTRVQRLISIGNNPVLNSINGFSNLDQSAGLTAILSFCPDPVVEDGERMVDEAFFDPTQPDGLPLGGVISPIITQRTNCDDVVAA